MIKISLLVTCYNAEKYVQSFLNNLAQLTKQFDEVLFYDDCSTDNTVELLLIKNLQVIKGDFNNGPGYARNRLAENANCEYIHFHDIDDEFNPNFLDLINLKINEQNYDVIVGYADWIDAHTRISQIKWIYNSREIEENKLAYFISHPLGIINTVYKKNIFEQTGGFSQDIKCWEDADLHVKLAALDVNFGVINEVIAYSIRHNNGISKNQGLCWQCRLKFLTQYLNKYPNYQKIIVCEIVKAINNLIVFGNFKYANTGITLLRNIKKETELSQNKVLKVLINIKFPTLYILILKKYITVFFNISYK